MISYNLKNWHFSYDFLFWKNEILYVDEIPNGEEYICGSAYYLTYLNFPNGEEIPDSRDLYFFKNGNSRFPEIR